MQIKKRLFTYPILTRDRFVSTYDKKVIELIADKVEDDYTVYLNSVQISTDSELISSMIKQRKVKAVVIIECPYTIIKKTYEIYDEPINIILPKKEFAGKVEFSLIVYALDNMEFPSNDEFDVDYRNVTYQINKYQILAYDDGFSFNINHQDTSDNLAKSIFEVVRYDEDELKEYTVQIKTEKITILLGAEIHDIYQKISNIDYFAEEFFCSLLIPALIEGLYLCLEEAKKDSTEDIDEIGEKYLWFNSVCDAYKRLEGKDLTIEEFKSLSMVEFAQKLLGSPIKRALETIDAKTMQGDDSDDEQ